MKIAVIGYNATGKTTLSRILSDALSIPMLILDDVRYDGEENRPLEEALKEVDDFLLNNESWILDGNQPRLREKEKLAAADYIIFFNFSRLQSLLWAFKRQRENKRNKIKNPREKVGFDYFMYTIHGGRTWRQSAHWNRVINRHPEKVIILKKKGDIQRLLNGELKPNATQDKKTSKSEP